MGFLADFCKADRGLWDRAFGTTKESVRPRQLDEGRGRNMANDAATRRFLQALRSDSPGTWTDDRFEASRHWTGIVYLAGHRKCEQMAQSEFQVFFSDPNAPDGKRPVTRRDTEAWRLVKLLERPNHDDSFGDLLYRWSQQMDLTGSALTWMVESKAPSALEGKGLPMELYPVPTATLVPQATMSPDFPEGYYRAQPVYPYGPFSTLPSPLSSVGAPIDSRWVLKFRFPHPLLRYEGYAPLSGIRLHADEVESIDRSRWYKMKRSVNPAAVMNFSEVEGMETIPDPEIARIHAEWENSFQGPENHGRLIVGIPGSTIEEFGTRPVDMEYQAGWEQLVGFVMAALGITKPAAGMIEDASYATLFATLKQLHLLTLKPMCERFSSKLTRHLAPFFGDDLIVEIRCPRIDDHDVKNAKLSLLATNKALTVNELRKELDMPLTKEEWGEERVGEQSQGQGMPGMEGPAGPEQGKPAERMQSADHGMEAANADMTDARGDKLVEEEIAKHQPKPGALGRGALGPRKSLTFNGNGKHRLVA